MKSITTTGPLSPLVKRGASSKQQSEHSSPLVSTVISWSSTSDPWLYLAAQKIAPDAESAHLCQSRKGFSCRGCLCQEAGTETSGHRDPHLTDLQIWSGKVWGLICSLCLLYSWGWPLWVSKWESPESGLQAHLRSFDTYHCLSEQNQINATGGKLFIPNHLNFSDLI